MTGQDAGELGLFAWTVYINANNDGLLDNSETNMPTLPAGTYNFSGLPAGAYVIRAIRPSGWSQTTPTSNFGQHVTVATNQTKTGILFGERQIA